MSLAQLSPCKYGFLIPFEKVFTSSLCTKNTNLPLVEEKQSRQRRYTISCARQGKGHNPFWRKKNTSESFSPEKDRHERSNYCFWLYTPTTRLQVNSGTSSFYNSHNLRLLSLQIGVRLTRLYRCSNYSSPKWGRYFSILFSASGRVRDELHTISMQTRMGEFGQGVRPCLWHFCGAELASNSRRIEPRQNWTEPNRTETT